MRKFILEWAIALPIFALAIVPAWMGLHFRFFLPYLGFIALFAVASVVWLIMMGKQDRGEK